MKTYGAILFVTIGLSLACHKNRELGSGGIHDWIIDSYKDGIIIVRHDGMRYQAKCESSRSFNNASSIQDPNNVHSFKTCDMAIDLVGHRIQPFESDQKGADGWITKMWSAGSILALRRWRDEHTPWRLDEFTITSVRKAVAEKPDN
jgi:hypothetical protein